ncbi:hypothetical protein D3C85_511970 [compost metagenome]
MALKFTIYGDSKPPANVGIGAGFEELIAVNEGQMTVALANRYRVGTRELQVYLNGVRQVIDEDYTEIDAYTIEFVEALEDGDKVFVTVGEVINQSLFQQFTANFDQTVFVLSKQYRVGSHALQVFENGQLLGVNEDYIEQDEYTIVFTQAPSEGARITVREVL